MNLRIVYVSTKKNFVIKRKLNETSSISSIISSSKPNFSFFSLIFVQCDDSRININRSVLESSVPSSLPRQFSSLSSHCLYLTRTRAASRLIGVTCSPSNVVLRSKKNRTVQPAFESSFPLRVPWRTPHFYSLAVLDSTPRLTMVQDFGLLNFESRTNQELVFKSKNYFVESARDNSLPPCLQPFPLFKKTWG